MELNDWTVRELRGTLAEGRVEANEMLTSGGVDEAAALLVESIDSRLAYALRMLGQPPAPGGEGETDA